MVVDSGSGRALNVSEFSVRILHTHYTLFVWIKMGLESISFIMQKCLSLNNRKYTCYLFICVYSLFSIFFLLQQTGSKTSV